MVETLPASRYVCLAIRQLSNGVTTQRPCLAQGLHWSVSAAKNDVILTRRQINQCLVSKRRCTVSTLNEIAANHARMAKLKEEESMRLSALQGQVVGSFEIPPIEAPQEMSLHFMTGVQDHSFGDASALSF
jgi:hypothetical protein